MGRYDENEVKLRKVVTDAENAFWEAVAKGFPEIKTGDLSPDADIPFKNAARAAVRAWLEENTPLTEYMVEYAYLDAKPNDVHRAIAYIRASDEDEARVTVYKGCARPVRIDRVAVALPVLSAMTTDELARAQGFVPSQRQAIPLLKVPATVWETPPSKHYSDADAQKEHEHDKGPGHTEALNEDWEAFVALLPEYKGWKATWEFPGYVRWRHPKLQLELHATPDWDTTDDEIVFDLLAEDGDTRVAPIGPAAFEQAWTQGDLIPWPKDERTVESYMAAVRPKIDGVMAIVEAYRESAIRMLADVWDVGNGEDGDVEVDEVPDFCPIEAELPGAWVTVKVFIDKRDAFMTDEKEDK